MFITKGRAVSKDDGKTEKSKQAANKHSHLQDAKHTTHNNSNNINNTTKAIPSQKLIKSKENPTASPVRKGFTPQIPVYQNGQPTISGINAKHNPGKSPAFWHPKKDDQKKEEPKEDPKPAPTEHQNEATPPPVEDKPTIAPTEPQDPALTLEPTQPTQSATEATKPPTEATKAPPNLATPPPTENQTPHHQDPNAPEPTLEPTVPTEPQTKPPPKPPNQPTPPKTEPPTTPGPPELPGIPTPPPASLVNKPSDKMPSVAARPMDNSNYINNMPFAKHKVRTKSAKKHKLTKQNKASDSSSLLKNKENNLPGEEELGLIARQLNVTTTNAETRSTDKLFSTEDKFAVPDNPHPEPITNFAPTTRSRLIRTKPQQGFTPQIPYNDDENSVTIFGSNKSANKTPAFVKKASSNHSKETDALADGKNEKNTDEKKAPLDLKSAKKLSDDDDKSNGKSGANSSQTESTSSSTNPKGKTPVETHKDESLGKFELKSNHPDVDQISQEANEKDNNKNGDGALPDFAQGFPIPPFKTLLDRFIVWAKKNIKEHPGLTPTDIDMMKGSFKDWIKLVYSGNYSSSDEGLFKVYDSFMLGDGEVNHSESGERHVREDEESGDHLFFGDETSEGEDDDEDVVI